MLLTHAAINLRTPAQMERRASPPADLGSRCAQALQCDAFQPIAIGNRRTRGIIPMKRAVHIALMAAAFLLTAADLQAQKIKVIVDQDARGPATTDMQSILIFLQSDKFD